MANIKSTSNPDNPRRSFLKTAAKGSIAALSLSGIAVNAFALQSVTDSTPANENSFKPDHLIRSTPENTVWGYYGADVPPVARIKNGDIAEIQTVNTTGISRKDPEAFYKNNNLP